MSKKTKINISIFSVFIILFCFYNVLVYTSQDSKRPVELSYEASRGQVLWQNNNCWSCHQVYGLGGYLGPDLTNVYSARYKGENYIKAFLNSGLKQMPKFNFSEDEKDALVTYLKFIDSTGYYPNYDASFEITGWVDLENKNE